VVINDEPIEALIRAVAGLVSVEVQSDRLDIECIESTDGLAEVGVRDWPVVAIDVGLTNRYNGDVIR
jgi:hypothetical protein